MHAGVVQRKSSVYRPGRTKAQTSSRVSPLTMTARHRRQRARPDGASLIRYVLFFCLKPLLDAGREDGGGGAGEGMDKGCWDDGAMFTSYWVCRTARCARQGAASVCASATPHAHALALAAVCSPRGTSVDGLCNRIGKPPSLPYPFPPTIYTTPNRLLSSLVGACKKCRQSPILMVLLFPHIFTITEFTCSSRA